MKFEDNEHFLNEFEKKLGVSIKEKAWDEIGGQLAALQRQIADSPNSKSDKNWQRDGDLEQLAPASDEEKLGRAVADGFGWEGYLAEVPACLGLLGANKSRVLDLVELKGEGICFYEFKVTHSAEDIHKALRQLILLTAFFKKFLSEPQKFGYNTQKSPLLLESPALRWELVAPLDMLNPRKSDMRWVEKDIAGIRLVMQQLGVQSFWISRLQAEAEALRAGMSKSSFSAARARQWFENRTAVQVA